ncbi:hypothetical protein [Sporisorium scitamineum]|uniref:Uncharacterized protein n=1 Tax=Sporisorium scitamineum TaxID=49012 RepID=A0A0F7RWL7_9BASI|nr:hypothetical protein [Sporisorium scitamineum]
MERNCSWSREGVHGTAPLGLVRSPTMPLLLLQTVPLAP